MKTRLSTRQKTDRTALASWLLGGFVFWLILGFPFQHHNESYVWASYLEQGTFVECAFSKLASVANFRPLGQATAWLTYRLSEGSVVPAQAFNVLVTLAAWLVAFFRIDERHIFSVTSFFVAGTLFSGYIFIFHLHGVFYAPVLLLLSILVFWYLPDPSPRSTILATVLSVVAALFHPYALILFLSATTGLLLEHRATTTRAQFVTLLSGAVVAGGVIVLLVILPGNQISAPMAERWAGFLTSYKATEVHPVIAAVVGVFIVATVSSTANTIIARVVRLAIIAPVVLGTLLLGFPLLLVWIAVSAVKAFASGRFGLGALIIGSALLPAIAPTGSPTYAVYVCMLCAITLPLGWRDAEHVCARLRPAIGISVLSLVIVTSIVMRVGGHVPVLSPLAAPMIAEREKTEQMSKILEWWRNSAHAESPLLLARDAKNPVDERGSLDRRFRPPTSNVHLRTYFRWLGYPVWHERVAPEVLLVYFGGEHTGNDEILYEVTAPVAGPARVTRVTQ